MTTKTTNEMILATLRTKGDKPAKYAEDLRALGYEVTNTEADYRGREYQCEYWEVNGLHASKFDDGALYLYLRAEQLKGLKAMAKVDFVNYFATLDARKAKAGRMKAHGNIWQRERHYSSEVRVCINPEARIWEREYRFEKRHYSEYWGGNETIEEYKRLSAKANGRRTFDGNFDDLRWAEEHVEKAKAAVQAALAALEDAQKDLAKEQARAAASNAELDAFLKARGIRK